MLLDGAAQMAFGFVRINGLSPCPTCYMAKSDFGVRDVPTDVEPQRALRRTIRKERRQLRHIRQLLSTHGSIVRLRPNPCLPASR